MEHDHDRIWLHNPNRDDNTLFYRRKDGIAVEHMLRPASHRMPLNHFHPEYEIFFLLHGKRQILYENRPYFLEEGGLALINSGRIHRTSPAPEDENAFYERIILYLNKEKIDKYDQIFPELGFSSFFQQHEGTYALSAEEREKLTRMFETIMGELKGEQSWSRTLVDLTIMDFFINFWRRNRPEVFFQEKTERRKRGKFPLVHEVSEYISEHFCEHIPLEAFAERFSVSESYLSRSFKDVMGIGMREYINVLRIRKAQEMMEDSALSISEIAEAVGFDSASYFGRVFMNHLAISPSQYRKEFANH